MRLEFSLVLFSAGAMWLAGEPLDTPSSAEACGRCHRAIHEAWKTSAHSRATESRLFQDSLELAETEYGADTRKVCLSCHSPLASRTADFRLRRKVSWEGVTCDYCHSIHEVTFNGQNPGAKLEMSLVKTGPLKDAVSDAHGTLYSEVHTCSNVCAPCHDYQNPLGFPVLTTFSEWRASKFAKENKTCQSCHMYKVAGDVVDAGAGSTGTSKVNLHQMPGSHSVDQLASTVKAQLSTERQGDTLIVFIEVANAAAGHYVPTGSPMRQVVLEVRADAYDGKHYREQRIYRRTVAGQDGKEIDREPTAFLRAASVLSDTRLAPQEKRRETFKFPIAAATQAQVGATFWYYYSPLARTEAEKRITFLSLQRLVK